MIDMHQLNAEHWGVTRQRAKQRAFPYVYSQGWNDGGNDLMATFLDFCHPDVRFEYLKNRGIVLGEN